MRRGLRAGAPIPESTSAPSTVRPSPFPFGAGTAPPPGQDGDSRPGGGEASSRLGSCIPRSVRNFVRLFTSGTFTPELSRRTPIVPPRLKVPAPPADRRQRPRREDDDASSEPPVATHSGRGG